MNFLIASRSKIARFILLSNLYVLPLCVSVFGMFHLMHMDHLYEYFKVVNALSFFSIMIIFALNGFKMNFFDVVMLFLFQFLLCMSSVIGLIHSFEVTRIVVDYVSLLMPILIFFILKNSKNTMTMLEMKKYLNYIVVLQLVFLICSFIAYYVVGFSFNLTLGTPLITLSALFFIREKIYLALILLVVLFSGKRSILLLTVFSLLFYRLRKYFYRPTFNGTVLMMVFIGVALVCFASFFLSIDYLAELNPKLLKLKYLNIFADDFDSYRFSTGRLDEVTSAYKSVKQFSLYYLFGAGAGFSYKYFLPQFNYYEVRNNLHISPLSLYFKYGIIFMVVFYTYFTAQIVKCIRTHKLNWAGMSVGIYLLLFILFYSNTSFAFAVDYVFWILMGIFVGNGMMKDDVSS